MMVRAYCKVTSYVVIHDREFADHHYLGRLLIQITP